MELVEFAQSARVWLHAFIVNFEKMEVHNNNSLYSCEDWKEIFKIGQPH